MEFYFLDESGDQGADGSKHIVLTLLKIRELKKAVKIIRNAKRSLLLKSKGAKWLNQHGGEIKFYGFPDENLLLKILKEIAALKPEIIYVVAEKGGLPFRTEQKILPLMFESLNKTNSEMPKKIIADLDFVGKNSIFFALSKTIKEYSTQINTKEQEVFVEAIKIKMTERKKIQERGIPVVEITHKSSRINEGLQIVDLVSGSIYQKYEHNKEKYLHCLETEGAKISHYRTKREK